MTGWDNTAAVDAPFFVPPPGWGRWTDHIRARLRAHSIDEQLLNGGAANGDPVFLVRRGKLLGRRYRSRLATALRKLVGAARGTERGRIASLRLRRKEVLANAALILTLADELESDERISARGVILCDRLITDGDSPVYAPLPVSRRFDQTVDATVRHARAALHLG